MIYVGTLRMFWLPFVLVGFAAIALRIGGRKAASRFLAHGFVGAIGGFVIAPLVGALVGSVPLVMIQPQYFFRPFIGCIAPAALFLASMTCISGVLLGFAGATYVSVSRPSHA